MYLQQQLYHEMKHITFKMKLCCHKFGGPCLCSLISAVFEIYKNFEISRNEDNFGAVDYF